MISGSGKLVTPVPSTAMIAPGEPADLVLRDRTAAPTLRIGRMVVAGD